MTCDEIQARFTALIDDDVTVDERRTLERHVAGCPECTREWARFTNTVGLLRGLEPAQAPAGFVDRVVAAAAPRPWYRRLLGGLPPAARWATAAAVLAVVTTIGYAGYVAREPARVTVARAPAPDSAPAPAPPPARESARASAPEITTAAPRDVATAPAREAPASPARTDAETATPAPRHLAAPAPPAVARQENRESMTREAPAALKAAPPQAPAVERPATRGEPPRAVDQARARRGDEGARGYDGKSADRVEGYRPAVVAPGAPPRPPGAVVGRLVVLDPTAVEQVLGGLAARFDARLVSRTSGGAGVALDFAVPPATASRFLEEIAQLGRWSPERPSDGAATRTRVIIHLTR